MPVAQAVRRSLVLALVPALAAFALALVWPAASEASHCSELEGDAQKQCVKEAKEQCDALGVEPSECEEAATNKGTDETEGTDQTDETEGTGGGDGTTPDSGQVGVNRQGCAPGFHRHDARGCHRIGLNTAARTCAPGFHAHNGLGCHRHFVRASLAQTGFDALPFALLGLVSLGGAFLLRRRLRHDS